MMKAHMTAPDALLTIGDIAHRLDEKLHVVRYLDERRVPIFEHDHALHQVLPAFEYEPSSTSGRGNRWRIRVSCGRVISGMFMALLVEYDVVILEYTVAVDKLSGKETITLQPLKKNVVALP